MVRKARRPSGLKVDFSGVESRTTVPPGDYHVKVTEVTDEVGSESGQPYLAWKLAIISDDSSLNDQTLYLNTSLQPRALWNLRQLLEALGVDVPEGPMDLDLGELVDCEMIASVEQETYEGKKRARIVDYSKLEDAEEEEEEDVPPPTRKEQAKGKKSKRPKLTEEEVLDMDEDELDELVEKYELGDDLLNNLTKRKKYNAIIDMLESTNQLAESTEDNED